MFSEELMIGDWVICHHPTMPVDYVQITADWLDTMVRIEHGHIKENEPIYRIFKPIPITTELLEKNGFVSLTPSGIYCYPDTTKAISIVVTSIKDAPNNNGDYIVGVKHIYTDAKIAISYVHQLQQVLRICGVEKEIII